MTVKQSETETFNPDASGDMLDASLDAIIAGTGRSADGLKNEAKNDIEAQGHGNNTEGEPQGESGGDPDGEPHAMSDAKNGTPRPLNGTPLPASLSGTPPPQAEGGIGSQTLLGIGALGLPSARGPFPAFDRKPAADDPEEEPAPLSDPLAAQAQVHRDRALGRLPGVSPDRETPPPPASAAAHPDPGLTPPPPASLGLSQPTVASVDLPSVDHEEIEDAAPHPDDQIDPQLMAAARSQEEREIRSSDLEFEEPDDGPTSLNPEIGQALQDADFFPTSFAVGGFPSNGFASGRRGDSGFATPPPSEASAPLFPTGAPRTATPHYPRLVTPPPADDTPGDLPPFNLTLPPPGRPPGALSTGSMPSLGGSPSQPLLPVSLASSAGGMSMQMPFPTLLANRGFTRTRLMMGGAFAACVLAGVLIDKAFFHHGGGTSVSASPPAAISAPAAAPSTEPSTTSAPVGPAPPAIVPVQAGVPSATAVAEPSRVEPSRAEMAKAEPSKPDPVKAAPPVSVRRPAPAVAIESPAKVGEDAERASKSVVARPAAPRAVTATGVEPVAARPSTPHAAAAPKVATPKPPVRPAARPKTKWVDPFAP